VPDPSGSETTADHSVGAVIVSYNPPSDVLRNIAILRPQVSALVVVDNGSSKEQLAMLRAGRSEYAFQLIENGSNLGIAAALNVGVREVKAKGYSWIALFDQDSVVGVGFIDSMWAAFANAPNSAQVGIACPAYIDRGTGIKFPIQRSKSGEIPYAITSGSLIPLELFDQIGMFNEALFMDYVDVEFCLRSRGAGYSIVQSERAVLFHSLGRITRHDVFGCQFGTTNHSAARRYYITRNRLRVLWQFLSDLSWSTNEARSFVAETVKIALVEEDRLEKLKSIVLGCSDALRGRMGKRFDL